MVIGELVCENVEYIDNKIKCNHCSMCSHAKDGLENCFDVSRGAMGVNVKLEIMLWFMWLNTAHLVSSTTS
jgi:hypothetical protein